MRGFQSRENGQCHVFCSGCPHTRKNAQVVTDLQTSCYKSVQKPSTSCVRAARFHAVVVTRLEQAVNNLYQA